MTMEAVIKPTDNEIIANALESLSSTQKQMLLEREAQKETIKKEKYKFRVMVALMILFIVLMNLFYLNIINKDRDSQKDLISHYNTAAINNKYIVDSYKQRERILANRLNYMNVKSFQYVMLSIKNSEMMHQQKLESYSSKMAILDTVNAIYLNNPDVIPEYIRKTKENLINPNEIAPQPSK
jgi:hypothetical protein